MRSAPVYLAGMTIQKRSLLVALLSMLLLLGVQAWPVNPSSASDSDLYDSFSVQRLQHDPEDDTSESKAEDVLKLPSSAAKRALSIFAHWRPHYAGDTDAIGSGSDFVSAVARGGNRPLGQPLRWG